MSSQSRRQVAKFIARQLHEGESSQRIAKVLAAYLVEAKQQRQADLLLRDIRTELLESYNHLSADVISARKLTDETRESVMKLLRAETGAKNIELTESVDADLIGGVIIQAPEAELDASLKSKLTKLRAM